MAHKKGQGSTRNGRDSQAQRRGVKAFDGEVPQRRFNHSSPGWDQGPSREQCRDGQGLYTLRTYRRDGKVREERRKKEESKRLRILIVEKTINNKQSS